MNPSSVDREIVDSALVRFWVLSVGLSNDNFNCMTIKCGLYGRPVGNSIAVLDPLDDLC